jgi:Superfamily II DNA/RNA helicases, SNF2 family
MNRHWEIKKNLLRFYDENGKESIPFASTVLDALHGVTTDFPSPSENFPDLLFSSIAAELYLQISFNEENHKIVLFPAVRRGKNKQTLSLELEEFRDHIVVDKTWRFINNFEDLTPFLSDAGIPSFGEITLQQYLNIKRIQSSDKYLTLSVEDNASAFIDNHPLSVNIDEEKALVTATLYPYQSVGFSWMKYVTDQDCGCILGDEMGLGKTLQVITLIASRKGVTNNPSLIIMPVSLLENWRREFEKFTTGIDVYIHHGSKRTGLYTELLKHDVVLISYTTATTDFSMLTMVPWDLVVVDEAQGIKNPDAQRTRSIKALPRRAAVAISGTPFENHILDVWSIMDYVEPGYLGTKKEFEASYSDDIFGAEKVESSVTPLMLRRRVADVAQDLPDRIDIEVPLDMPDKEAEEYEEYRQAILSEYVGNNASLPLLQKLRMFCTHPEIIRESRIDPTFRSLKYERLCEMLDEISSSKEKCILFTSYTKMFDLIRTDIQQRIGITVLQINGETPVKERQEIVDRFSAIEGSALLVLNPKAAGTGLNITAATRVIHYNLEWNPAVEDQASARAYRRGQTKKVFVYRLFYRNTVEEIVNERIAKKRDMFQSAIVGTDGSQQNTEDIIRALMITPKS